MSAALVRVERLPLGPQASALGQTWAWARRPLDLLEAARKAFGPTFTLRFVGDRAYVILTEPDHVRAAFTAAPDVLISGNQGMKPFVGPGSMFVLDGDPHRRHRRLVGPALRGERLGVYGRAIEELTEHAVAEWPRDRAFPLAPRLRDLTLQVIFRVVFGVTHPERAAILARYANKMMTGVGAKLAFVPFLRIDLGPLSPWGRFLRLRAKMRAIVQEDIDALRATSPGRDDILARMVNDNRDDREPLLDDEIHSELLTLLGAGHETTTAGLAWTFQWVLASQEITARVTEECRAGTSKAADELTYLGAAISETLRLMPPIPIVPRLAAKTFAVAGFELPAGTYVTPSPYLVHHDPEIHASPGEFRPERFLGGRPGPFEYFPYGGGGRLCIGAAFANYEMAAIVRAILSRVSLELVGSSAQAPVRHGITLAPSEGTLVRITGRAT